MDLNHHKHQLNNLHCLQNLHCLNSLHCLQNLHCLNSLHCLQKLTLPEQPALPAKLTLPEQPANRNFNEMAKATQDVFSELKQRDNRHSDFLKNMELAKGKGNYDTQYEEAPNFLPPMGFFYNPNTQYETGDPDAQYNVGRHYMHCKFNNSCFDSLVMIT